MGYYCSSGAVSLQAGSYQRRCYAQSDMDYPRGHRKTDDFADKKRASCKVSFTKHGILHMYHGSLSLEHRRALVCEKNGGRSPDEQTA